MVEGARLYQRAIASGLTPQEVFVAESHPLTSYPEAFVVADVALDKASYRNRSEGLIAVFPQFGVGLADLRLPHEPFLLVVESIEKPGNLGAMVRTANAAGAANAMTSAATIIRVRCLICTVLSSVLVFHMLLVVNE